MTLASAAALLSLALSVALLLVAINRKQRADAELQRAEAEAQRVVSASKREADNLRKEAELAARERQLAMETAWSADVKERSRELQSYEQRLNQREEGLDRRAAIVDRKEFEVEERSQGLKAREEELSEAEGRAKELLLLQRRRLEELSGISADVARADLIRLVEVEARQRAAMLSKKIEDDAVAHAESRARSVIGGTIQRIATAYCLETTVTVLDLPSDEMKGRIIGREGRNIRALERATGVDLIVDDTPEAILLSSFDPIRREVARTAIKELIRDGRIHPARIEEAVAKARRDLDEGIREAGQEAVNDLGFVDMHPDLVRVVGRLKYRTSYGQNMLMHAREVAFIAGAIAAELGGNVETARRGGFLHDIGKAIDREVEGTHTQIGVELCKKYGERPDVIHCIASHHMDVEFESVEAMIVQAADALSAARPGARREILETYIKRLEKLEAIASTFKGVAKSYAIQAGREIRIVVEADKVSDEEAHWLSKDIARKIEGELQYPGQIKVTVIREVRAVDYAR